MCTYLAKRDSTYYFRRPVPEALRPIVGRREWMVSLRTKDRASAKLQLPLHMHRTDKEIRDAEAKLKAGWTPAQPSAAAFGPVSREQLEAEEEMSRISAEEDWIAEEQAGGIAALEAMLDQPISEVPPGMQAAVLLLRHREYERQIAEERRIADEVTARDTPASLAERAQAEAAREHADKSNVVAMRTAKGAESISILATFDAYAKDAGQKPSTIRNMRPHIQRLVAYLGHDDLARVSTDDLLGWIEALRETEGRQGSKLSAKTIRDGYFATVRATFVWAMEKRKRLDNPALGIRVRGKRAPRLRDRGFTDAEAETVLRAARAYTGQREKACYVRAIKWMPWILAYTGARGGEIAQLRAEDIQQSEGMWTILITPEAGSVKTNEARRIPMHSHLIELGLPEMAAEIGSGPLFYEPSAGWRIKSKPIERVCAFVRSLGIEIAQPTHGWRHRFKTEGRRWDMDSEAVDVIQGHAPATEGKTYGATVLVWQARSMEKLPRFELGDA